MVGIEPTLTVLETGVLPLYDTPVSDPSTHRRHHSKIRPKAEGLLFAFVVNIILTAKATVFRQRKLFFHFLFVASGVMRNTATFATFQFCHCVFDVSHTIPVSIRY